MNLRELMQSDVQNIFFNLEELAQLKSINGTFVPVVEDGEQLLKYRQQGIYEGVLLLYVRQSDLPIPPEPGDALIYGTRKLWVESCNNNGGVLELVLKQYRGN